MTPRSRFLVVLCAVLQFNEASGSAGTAWKVASMAEIRANMTSEVALRTVLGMNRTHQEPQFLDLITSIGRRGRAFRMKEVVQLQVGLRGTTNPQGYSGVEKATFMLNEMTSSSQTEYDGSVETCDRYDRRTTVAMNAMRLAVSTFNSQAAEARGRVIYSQGKIASLTIEITQTTEAYERHLKQCREEIDEMKRQLVILNSDIVVMEGILNLTKCDATFLLVQCGHCNNAIYLQHDHVAKMLGKLQSNIAKEYVQSSLDETYHESLDRKQPLALTQEDVVRLRRRDTFAVVPMPLPVGGVNTSDVPTALVPFDCQPTNKCTLTPGPSCQRLLDRFLGVQAGITDQRDIMDGRLYKKEEWCRAESLRYTQQISALNEELRKEQAALAKATEDQNIAETGSHQAATLHKRTAKEYRSTLSDCCNTQNEKKSEMCALEKIRGELMKLEGTSIFMTNCVVSEWRRQECTATCGGGTTKKSRSVIVQPGNGGVPCPPLEAFDTCSEEPCPIDCKLYDWSGWSVCSAECGGGVREKSRDIEVPPAHGGEPCEVTEAEEACNIQDCSGDCLLTRWSQWSSCSKACGKGSQRRTKAIDSPAKGDGICWESTDQKRLQFADCNDFACIVPAGRPYLHCESKVDVVILLDGSASLGRNGWAKSKKVAERLIKAFGDGNAPAKVALQVFSGPKTWKNLKLCQKGEATDLKGQCGIEWIEKGFTDDTDGLSRRTRSLDWPRSSTFTSGALGQAESMLVYGREDAAAVVIVITDGKPYSPEHTEKAAESLMTKAKLLWVPVGRSAPIALIKKWASKPESDHVVVVQELKDLASSETINKIITTTCPVVS